VVPMSLGLRPSMEAAGQVSEEETATVQHLHVMLQEIDRCRSLTLSLSLSLSPSLPLSLTTNCIVTGRLKILDFGLCTCIPRSTCANDTYQLSGLTGTVLYCTVLYCTVLYYTIL
jgi:hypothetical protein